MSIERWNRGSLSRRHFRLGGVVANGWFDSLGTTLVDTGMERLLLWFYTLFREPVLTQYEEIMELVLSD